MDEGKLLDHEYDGIRELDNALPRWWLGTFYGTILFSAIYFAHYVLGPGPTLNEEYERAAKQRELTLLASAPRGSFPDEDALLAAFNDEGKVRGGSEIYQSKCASCHGPQGQGTIGPNLTDSYWIHGGKAGDIARVVHKGVAEKGMPPWGSVLSEAEVYSVIAYVHSIRGSEPPNPKAPQGELYKE